MTTDPRIVEVDGPSYRTPLTPFAGRRVGRARLRSTSLPRGYYPAEGTYGFEYIRTMRGRLTTTELQRRGSSRDSGWQTWMTDDWLHWHAMRERVVALPGDVRSVVCAGLGLGLMLHHFKRERPDIERITVVELDPDVVALIRPTLPIDPRVAIVVDDYYRFIEREDEPAPDAVLWDLAVGEKHETRDDVTKGIVLTARRWPNAYISVFGLRLNRPGRTGQEGTPR